MHCSYTCIVARCMNGSYQSINQSIYLAIYRFLEQRDMLRSGMHPTKRPIVPSSNSSRQQSPCSPPTPSAEDERQNDGTQAEENWNSNVQCVLCLNRKTPPGPMGLVVHIPRGRIGRSREVSSFNIDQIGWLTPVGNTGAHTCDLCSQLCCPF